MITKVEGRYTGELGSDWHEHDRASEFELYDEKTLTVTMLQDQAALVNDPRFHEGTSYVYRVTRFLQGETVVTEYDVRNV